MNYMELSCGKMTSLLWILFDLSGPSMVYTVTVANWLPLPLGMRIVFMPPASRRGCFRLGVLVLQEILESIRRNEAVRDLVEFPAHEIAGTDGDHLLPPLLEEGENMVEVAVA